MMQVNNIFNNQWVVNIGTGLIVYIVTSIFSKIIFNKATNKEKQKQINAANKEVIRILKPYVVDKNILDIVIIKSIIESVARTFNISSNDMFSVKEICEELTRGILESSYVDNEKKVEYVFFLNNIIDKYVTEKDNHDKVTTIKKQVNQIDRYRNLYKFASLYMAFLVVIITVLVTIFSENEMYFFSEISEPLQISTLILIIELSMVLPMIYITILKKIKKQKQEEKVDKILSEATDKKNNNN